MTDQLRLSRALLSNIAAGQQQRNILDNSKRGYMSKMKVLTTILNNIVDYREHALQIDNNSGEALKHTDTASNIYKLKLPMTEETAVLLFAAISIDGSLSRKRKRRRRNQRPSSDSDDNSDSGRDEQSTVVIRAVPIVRSRAELENVAHANNNNDFFLIYRSTISDK